MYFMTHSIKLYKVKKRENTLIYEDKVLTINMNNLILRWGLFLWGFPDSSVGKESACNAGDHSSIPGSGRSAGEGTGHPLQCSWTSLVAPLVKNLPATRETWVRSLGWEDPLEKRTATHSQYSGLENSMDCIVHGVAKSWTRLSNLTK